MEITKKTFAQIRAFNIAVGAFAKNPVNMETKLGYAIKRVADKSLSGPLKEYQNHYMGQYYNDVEKVQIDNALTDKETGAILKAPEGSEHPYLYNAEGLKKVREAELKFEAETAPAILKEWDIKEFDIETYYATELPYDLSTELVEAVTGFAIKEGQEIPVRPTTVEKVEVIPEI
jgi:hypothetical protein